MSISINICLTYMIVSRTITMVTKDANQISSYTTAFDVDSLKAINYNETQMIMYHVLKKQTNEEPIFLNESTSQYIDMFFT